MLTHQSIIVQGVEVHLYSRGEEDYLSLSDMVQTFDGRDQLIINWLRDRNTLEFLAVWERLNNPHFDPAGFERIRDESGLNRFTMSVRKWGERTGGIGLLTRTGRQKGVFAHKDIAFEFGSWLSPEFKLYLIKEFQRFRHPPGADGQVEWDVLRRLTKTNARLYTDAVRAHLIPPELSPAEASDVYASEADLLNEALFGMDAETWRTRNPGKAGNIRDYASVEQLIVLASLESQNALLIQQGIAADARLLTLNQLARAQMQSLLGVPGLDNREQAHLVK